MEHPHRPKRGAWNGHRIFVKEPGAPGRDPDGWLPGEKKAADEAAARGDFLTIINVTERKSEASNLVN